MKKAFKSFLKFAELINIIAMFAIILWMIVGSIQNIGNVEHWWSVRAIDVDTLIVLLWSLIAQWGIWGLICLTRSKL